MPAVPELIKKKQKNLVIEYPGGSFDFSKKTYIMGILNVTPDSFSDGGRYYSSKDAVERGLVMSDEGADMIDVGGESSRPGSLPVSAEEEMRRVLPVVEKLSGRLKIPISIDTCKASVAERSLETGARMINDISALRFDHDMGRVAAHFQVPVVLMHMRGYPANMQDNVVYYSLVSEITEFLKERIEEAERMGISSGRIIIDPGIGFGKSVIEGNLAIIKQLSLLQSLNKPILIGPSRKSFIGKILDEDGEARDEGTAIITAIAINNGANIIRVHDVKRLKKVVKIMDTLKMIN
jgi:dihydropteroate synthase